jgi:TolB-like protein/DNA-binding winged helix-turn-helix (wHTH) protein/Flp pilus assembly protein TadD
MATTIIPSGYRLGPYTLELRSGELKKNGRRIRLQEKPRSLLIALAERPGEVITRSELHERLWPDDTFVDFEDGLNTAMRKLREALEDDPQEPRFIETVRGRGYRCIADIRVIPGVDESPAAAQPDPSLAPPSASPDASPIPPESLPVIAAARPQWIPRAGIAALCLLLIPVTVLTVRWGFSRRPVISVAVLPLANMTGDASRNYICNGITEELIAQLGQLSGSRLRVIAPTSSLAYANTTKPARQIGRELGVQYLIEGSLQQQGADFRVAVGLVRADDQARLWGNVYDGEMSNLFAMESTVADSVGHALSLNVPAAMPADYRPANEAAHDAYLKGLYFISQRSKSGFEQAIESFSNAVAIDPKYAAAYAQLASAYNLMGQYSWMDAKNARSQAWAAAEQALSLNPSQAQAHEAKGFSLWFYGWNPRDAEGEFRKAIALDPRTVDAHHHYAQLLMTAGRFPEAEEQMREAIELDPRSLILRTNLGWLYSYEGRFPDAIRQMQSAVEENPAFLTAHYKLWWTYSAAGDTANAEAHFRWVVRALADPPNQQKIESLLGKSGYSAALREFASATDTNYYGNSVDGARCMAFAGDRAGALRFLDEGYRDHEGWMLFVPRDPAFAQLHGDPHFEKLVASVTGAS